MEQIHSLLKRQLKRYFKGRDAIPEEWQGFIEAVNDAYWQSDSDRNMLERSMELSSQELLQANSELRAIFQALPDLFLRLDNEGTILDHKGGMANEMCFQVEELLGKGIHEVLLEKVGNEFVKAIHQVQETNSMVSIEYSTRMQEQEYFYETRLLPLLEDQVIAIVRNITELKHSEAEVRHERDKVRKSMEKLIETQNKLVRSERFAAIGEAAAYLSHEIKNPLIIIGGFARQVEKSLSDEDGNRQKLKIIQDEARRLELMLTDVRDFTRPSMPQKELQDINSIIENTLALLESDLKDKSISCKKSLDSDLPPIFFDPQQIEQLLINLAKNAIEAMPSGGKFFISSWREDKQVKVSAVDNGTGIPSEIAAKIFNPFFTTKKKGTGLGLAVCRKIIEDHEGEIRVQSEEGKGTKVTIILPIEEEETPT